MPQRRTHIAGGPLEEHAKLIALQKFKKASRRHGQDERLTSPGITMGTCPRKNLPLLTAKCFATHAYTAMVRQALHEQGVAFEYVAQGSNTIDKLLQAGICPGQVILLHRC